jgi:hypothetical protein
VDGDDDVVAVAGQGFVDGIVDDLENHVVQTSAVGGIADIHARTLAYRLQSFQLLNGILIVAAVFSSGLVVLRH